VAHLNFGDLEFGYLARRVGWWSLLRDIFSGVVSEISLRRQEGEILKGHINAMKFIVFTFDDA
jgi:hypothetical protein